MIGRLFRGLEFAQRTLGFRVGFELPPCERVAVEVVPAAFAIVIARKNYPGLRRGSCRA